MRIKDYTIENRRIDRLKKERDENHHVSSGGLSASGLCWPLQWQILKSMGIEPKVDDYALGLFERGKEVEEGAIKDIPDIVEKQKKVEYKGVVGIVDVICDTKSFEKDYGVIPLEIKSVKNAKFTRIIKEDDANFQYKVQASLYALALGTDHYGIVIKSAEDGRVLTYFYETNGTSEFIENVIREYSVAKQSGIVPEFSVRDDKLKWQAKPDYNMYPEFLELSSEEATELANKILREKK